MKYTFKHGWMGGTHLIDGERLVDKTSLVGKIAVIEEGKYEIFAKIVHGTDHDHGHEYPWSSYRYYIKEPSMLLGCNEVSFLDLLSEKRKFKSIAIED